MAITVIPSISMTPFLTPNWNGVGFTSRLTAWLYDHLSGKLENVELKALCGHQTVIKRE